MTSLELKHQAKLQEWAGAVQNCRSSGVSVKQWCREKGITTTTYYRWEREVLSLTSDRTTAPKEHDVAFAELVLPSQLSQNVSNRIATIRGRDVSIDIYGDIDLALLQKMISVLRCHAE